ncbi:MAG: hypothetical protein HQL75_18075 [Magnetococcales bacterium]|nr:hypothetical protein [Magnetococcales bacterium]
MLEISLSPEMESQLFRRASESGLALTAFLETIVAEYLEDQADRERAEAILSRNNPRYSLEEVEKV